MNKEFHHTTTSICPTVITGNINNGTGEQALCSLLIVPVLPATPDICEESARNLLHFRMPLLNQLSTKVVSTAASRTELQTIFSTEIVPIFRSVFWKSSKRSANLLKWRVLESFCLHWEGTQRVQAKKNVSVPFKTVKIEETSNFQNIPLFSSSVV